MEAVTISRQLGSLGFEIGKTLAEQIGYRFVWRELINQAAIRAGAPEVALAMIDELKLLGIYPSPEQCQAYIKAVATVLCELAWEGKVVIVGRGGQVVLRDHPDVLHVRVIAPLEIRVARVAASYKVSSDAALAQIQASDQGHKQYFQKFYQCQWDDPLLYDLVINTTRMDVDAAVQQIRQLLALPRLASYITSTAEDKQIDQPEPK